MEDDRVDAVLLEAEALLAMGEIGAARQVTIGALDDLPDHPRLLAAAALTLVEDDPARAVRYAERAVAAAPDSDEAQRVRALALLAAGRRSDAVSAALAAVRLAPDRAAPLAVLARALAESGDVRGAVAAAGRAVQAEPASPAGYLAQGTIALRGHQWDVAEANFAKALELRPGHVEATAGLEAVRRRGGPGARRAGVPVGEVLPWKPMLVTAAVVLAVLFLLDALR